MGKKKDGPILTSNTSSVANPKSSSTTYTAGNSSILKSSFAPSRYQLSLFASIIQGLDSQHLRIHHTSGDLRGDHALASRANITCLDWGYYGQHHGEHSQQDPSRKRKRSGQVNGNGPGRHGKDVVVAFGTSESQIQFYSPSEAKIVGELKNGHSNGINDFKFVRDGANDEAWSCGGDRLLIQWNLRKGRISRSLYPSATSVICASNVAHIVRDGDDRTSSKYNASNYPVHTILSQAEPKRALRFLTIAEIDRFINVFKEGESTLIGSMPTENEIMTADLWSIIGETSQDESSGTQISKPQEVLAALNKDGVLELFPQPFDFGSSPATNPSQSFKDRMKGRTRKPFAQIRTVRPDKRAMRIPLIDVSFDGNFLNLAWADGGVNVVFEKIQWRDDETGHMTVSGLTEITKSKSGAGLGAVGLNGVKDVGKSQVDDSQAVVTNGAESNETSSEAGENEAIEASSSEKDSDSEEDQEPPDQSALVKKAESDNSDGDVSMNDAEDAEGEQAENDGNHVDAKEPTSFGDLLKANARSTIDVSTALALSHEPQSLAPTHGNPPSTLQPAYQGLSLGTVLTQALRTNDTALLETCFHTHDLANIRATVERLESSFASTLLQKLAERLHNRPGRAGSLMVWIQWTLVAHGGYLAGQPDVMRKLRGLQRVVKERASSLRELLGLKGKLDMLEAQMNLRRSMIQRRRRVQDQKNDDEIDEAVIYVEGQDEEEDNEQDSSDDSDDEKEEEEEDSDAEDEDKTNNLSLKKSRSKSKPNPKSIKPTKPTRTRVSPSGNEDESEEDEDGDGDLNKTSINGISAPASASDDADPNSDSDSNDNNLLDDEASSTSGYGSGSTSDQDGEIDHEDVDTDSDSASNSDSDSASDIDIDPDIDGEAPASAPASASMSSSPDPDSTRGLESKRAVKKAKTGKGKGKGKGR